LNKRLVVLTIFLLLLSGFLVGGFLVSKNRRPYVYLNNQKIWLLLADNPQKRTQGLSGRSGLPQNSGLLFLFDEPGNYSFWMKEMKFSLDFVFIENDQIVDLSENVAYPQNGEEPQTIIAKRDFNKVLELNAGLVKKMGIRVGQKIKISQK